MYHASPSPPPQGQFAPQGYGYAPGPGYEQGGYGNAQGGVQQYGNVSPPPPPGPGPGQQMGGGMAMGPGGYPMGQQQMGPGPVYAAELPAQRGDGELRELHG
jgi:hypothetical protein